MLILSDLAKKYPLCTRFIKGELQRNFLKVARPQVFNAFEKACESARFAKEVLEYGNPPMIQVFLGTDDVTKISSDCGMNALDKSGIGVAAVIFDAFESGYDRNFTKLHLEATILHELVHWARDKAGLNSAIFDPKIVGNEAGVIFEIWAYGVRWCTEANRARLRFAANQGRNIQQVIDSVATVGPPPVRIPGL